MRQRLSWNLDKVAEQVKKADPYTMNQEHANNPVEKYHNGDPDSWAETPDMKTPWKNEGRTETGHPAPEREAVMAARKLEDKALKCITIAQRMLPGAVDASIEEQATDLMYLPERCIQATLQRQAELAEVLSGKDDDEDDDATAAKKEDEEEDKDAGKKEETTPPPEKKAKKEVVEEDEEKSAKKKDEEEEVEAAKKKDEEEDEEKSAKKKDEEEDEEKSAKKKEDEEEVEAKKKDEDEEEVEASTDFLDQFFAKEEVKTGAKKLSGIVKQASSTSTNDLSSLWDAPPDVSKNFK